MQDFKIEAIMSLWFLAGLSFIAVRSLIFLRMARQERENDRVYQEEAQKRYTRPHSDAVNVLIILFGSAAGYFGWFDFSYDGKAQHCIFEVPCFVDNDLLIIAAAGAKWLMIFGFLFGALIILYRLMTKVS